jgi:spermidine synthase
VLILLLAFLSGAAALIYEITWFQLLELVVGSSPVSLGILLATFMGGTCLGSLLFPRIFSSRQRPLRVYAAVEIGIATTALLALLLLPSVSKVYVSWSSGGLLDLLLRGVVAAVCLLPPTFLMGVTLPALSRCLNSKNDVSLGILYGSNLIGGVVGSLLSAFYLLRNYDVTTATLVAALVNGAVAALSLAASARRAHDTDVHIEQPARPTSDRPHAIYFAIGVSGFCALAAEAIWTRTLGLLLGGSVYTFAIILAVFLIGLGIGSGLGSTLSARVANPARALGWCQLLLTGAIAWTAYSLSASLPYWPINPSLSSSIWFNFQLDLDRTFWALLPPTIFWGASFPLALAAKELRFRDSGRRMANIYAANTVGAILGALSASLVFISWLGSQRAQQFLIAMSAIAALALMLSGLRMSGIAVVVATLLMAGFSISVIPPLSRLLVAHGRYSATWINKSDILYAEEGLNASVAVSSFSTGALTFHVAGKIQASTVPRDMRLQRMLGHLTTLTITHPSSVLVIGCGAGITAGAAAIDPKVERLTLVEIEPLVPQAAATFFGRQNFSVINNEKTRLHIEDGRHFLLTTREKFDGITADPLDPWVRGAANLYTKEFFEAARQHLNPGGVITVYIQLFETNLDAVKSAVATFFDVFPNGTVWGNTYEGKGHDMVLLGQVEPTKVDLRQIRERVNDPAYSRVIQSLREIDMNSPIDLLATYAGRASDLREWLRGATINRDRNLRMQYLAGLGLNRDESAAIYASMLAYRRFPEGLFTGSEEELATIRSSISGER